MVDCSVDETLILVLNRDCLFYDTKLLRAKAAHVFIGDVLLRRWRRRWQHYVYRKTRSRLSSLEE